MSRKLATIQRVKELRPIPEADAIETCLMEGNTWEVVVRKGEFKVGDLCVYFEIDSFLPKEERYSFLEGRSNKKMDGEEGYRLRTIKLKKQVSQGLILPLSEFPEILQSDGYYEGADATSLLKIKLYEEPVVEVKWGQVSGDKFPSFIQKTDQPRLQGFNSQELEEINNQKYEVTEKLDGTSVTIYYYKGDYGVCSRNLTVYHPVKRSLWKRIYDWFMSWRKSRRRTFHSPSVYKATADKYGLLTELPKFCEITGVNYAIQGEIVGPSINGNHLNLQEVDLYVFDVFDIDAQMYVSPERCREVVEILGLRHVPVLGTSETLDLSVTPVDYLIGSANGISKLANKPREGIVYKPVDASKNRKSFKIISNDYLLKHEC
jgi:RNA ligase (TIGR02306 family)